MKNKLQKIFKILSEKTLSEVSATFKQLRLTLLLIGVSFVVFVSGFIVLVGYLILRVF